MERAGHFKNQSKMQMTQSPRQDLRLAQKMIMSAHMKQALHLLQAPIEELENYIEEQIVLNPVLEIAEERIEAPPADDFAEREKDLSISDEDFTILQRLDDDLKDHFSKIESPNLSSNQEQEDHNYIESTLTYERTLHAELLQEAKDYLEDHDDLEIAKILIGYLDHYGFITSTPQEIAFLHGFNQKTVERVLKALQTFEPYGIGASSIQESLLIQLRCKFKENTLAYRIVQEHYDELIHHHIRAIQKAVGCSFEMIENAIDQDIAKLDLHPGINFSSHENRVIIPDALIRLDEGRLVVEVDRDFGKELRINRKYLRMLENPDIPNETKLYIRQHIFSAKWLVRNLQQRYSTLERVVQSLAKRQADYFLNPDGQLVPLNMTDVAEELGLHESTIARTVSNKYLFSPRGLSSLRSFFTSRLATNEGKDLSSETAKELIRRLIENENSNQPYSDEKLSELLEQQGIVCARRTVAKYRTALQIGNTQQRKRFTVPPTAS